MDRLIDYVGAIPLDTDLLNTNKNTMIALSKLAAAMFGSTTTGFVNGLTVAPTGPATLTVNVGPGEIYSLQNVDNSAYGSLAADTTHQIVKQGINLATVNLATPAPSTVGYSVNYLIEAEFVEADGGSTVLPYYNASNPSVAYSGPNNTGAPNNTVRACSVNIVAKAGAAATTGTQTTPAPDSGYVGIAVVTVAYGQANVSAGNITPYANAPVIGSPLTNGRLLNIQTFASAGSFVYTPTPGTTSVVAHVEGGAGGGGGSSATTSTQITAGSGGAGGAVSEGHITASFSGVTITVGAGGSGGAIGGNGGNGGASSFGSLIVCAGGSGGGASPAETGAFVNGNGSQAAVTTPGNIGSHKGRAGGYAFAFAATGAGFGISAAGADGQYGTGGVATNAQGNGAAGTGNNAGGAGAVSLPSAGTGFTGGAGTPGIVIVYEYA